MSAASGSGRARPRFHFTVASGWLNDPHGITWRGDHYEVFYQYVPGRLDWAPECRWGHARGASLFALEELAPAIEPGEGDGGIWSGCLVPDGPDGATAFYTAISEPRLGEGRVRVARPRDDAWSEWGKGDVVAVAPDGLGVVAFRDPFVRRDDDVWRMFVGAALAGGDAAALSYRSADLARWDYEGVALRRSRDEHEPVWTGSLWECPQILRVDDAWVMVSSVWEDDVLHHVAYAIGDYAEGVFTARSWGRLSYGPSYYAPSRFLDDRGRECLTFWLRGIRDPDAGWAGAHSVPHVLRVEGDRLIAEPHPDLDRLKGALSSDGAVAGTAASVLWTPEGGGVLSLDGLGARVRCADGRLSLATHEGEWSMPYGGGPVRVVADGPVIEISASAGVLAAGCRPSGDALSVHADRGDVHVHPLVGGRAG